MVIFSLYIWEPVQKYCLQFFLKKYNCNNNEIYTDNSDIVCNNEAIFPQSLSHFKHAFANVE
jgi:hypothetical protein